MNTDLNIAVVGLGYFSQFHLAAWAGSQGIGQISVTDPKPNRVAWAVKDYGVTGYADAASLLGEMAPDIVDIVAPPTAHATLIDRFSHPGRVIICQKPFCQSLAEAEAVVAQAEAKGVTLIVHENFRFQPWYRALKRELDTGRLGHVYQCRFALRPGDGRGERAYLERQPAFRDMPRLLIHETAVHFVDLFRWLFGDIRDIYADIQRLNPVIAGEDAGLMVLTHDSGTKTVFDGNRLSDHATDNPRRTMGEMDIEGEKGTLRLDGYGHLWFRPFGERDDVQIPIDEPVDDSSFGGGCVNALIQHVLLAVAGERALENEARDYLDVIKSVDAAYESAAKGKKIEL